MRQPVFCAVIAALFLLSACGGGDKAKEDGSQPELAAEELYVQGKGKLDEGYYKDAIKEFDEIERLYPFSKLATKGQVMAAYAFYKDEEYDDAIQSIERFVKLHPGHQDVPYMLYLRALCYYERIADVKRDQEITRQALASLEEVYRRYPDDEYGRDAKLKIDLVNDHLAGKEMEIGRFYLKQKKFVAAINRFRNVVQTYQTTTHVEEALYRLTEAYLSLGVVEEARRNAAVLGHNYPDSKWYKYAYRLTEEGKNSPVAAKASAWMPSFLSADREEKQEPLPRDNKADDWFNRLMSDDRTAEE